MSATKFRNHGECHQLQISSVKLSTALKNLTLLMEIIYL